MHKYTFLIPFFLVLIIFQSKADTIQQSIDSIEHKIALTKDSMEVVELKLKKAYLVKDFDNKLAEHCILQALESSKKNHYKKGEALCYLSLCDLYGEVSLDFSVDLINKALEINKHLQDSGLLMGILIRQGNLHNTHENHKDALKYYLERLRIGKTLNDSSSLGPTYNNIGMIYAYQDKFDSALHYFYQFTNMPTHYKQKCHVHNTLGNMAGVYVNLSEIDSSKLYFAKAIKLSDALNNQGRKGWLYNILSNTFLKENKFDSAFYYAHKGLQYGKKYNNSNAIEYSYRNLSRYHLQASIRDSAQYYQMLLDHIKDSVSVERSKSRLKLSLMQKELEVEMEKQEIKAQQEKNKILTVTLLVALVLIIVLFALYSVVQKQKRQLAENKVLALEKKQLEEDVNSANRKITSHLMNIISKNNMIEQLIKKLASHPIGFKEENQGLINEIVGELKLSLNTSLWEEFELRFTEVHPQFYTLLKSKHPLLTPTELRLCAFLKMNMTTKEIASLLLLNATSVEKSRVRLRKKLGINNTDVNLNSYIMQF